jgi:hypothetical protein
MGLDRRSCVVQPRLATKHAPRSRLCAGLSREPASPAARNVNAGKIDKIRYRSVRQADALGNECGMRRHPSRRRFSEQHSRPLHPAARDTTGLGLIDSTLPHGTPMQASASSVDEWDSGVRYGVQHQR